MGLFDSAKNTAINLALNSDMVKGLINNKLARYAEVTNLKKVDKGVEITAKPLGSNEVAIITAKDIVFADDGSSVTLKGLSSNLAWVSNLLQDFVEGKAFAIPEKYAGAVSKVRKVL